MKKAADPEVPADFPIRGWFADTHPDFRRTILALARRRSLPAGSVIYQAGDGGRAVFGISTGFVTLQCRFTHPDAILIHLLRPGEWFGTVPTLAGWTRRVSAIARTDVEILSVPGDELRALLRRHPEWNTELGRHVVGYLDLAMQGAADLLIRKASDRCAAVLLRLAGRRWPSEPNADLPAEIPASQAELAMLCNVSRNTFGRVMQEFTSRRLVTHNYRSMVVIDPARLRRLANGLECAD